MTWFLILSVVFFILLGFCFVQAIRFKNPYKLIMVFGKKGSGKTTFMTKTAIQHLRKGYTVYSTIKIPGTRLFDVNDIGSFVADSKAVLLIDEVGMIWDNRNFKNFRTDVRDYFKLQRHYHHKIYLFSQTFDIDVKLRNLCDSMYLVRCHMGFLSVARKIRRDIVIVDPTGDSESRIADSLQFEPLLLSLFGAKTIIFTYIPHWVGFFDSFEAPKLPSLSYALQDVPSHLCKSVFGKRRARRSLQTRPCPERAPFWVRFRKNKFRE